MPSDYMEKARRELEEQVAAHPGKFPQIERMLADAGGDITPLRLTRCPVCGVVATLVNGREEYDHDIPVHNKQARRHGTIDRARSPEDAEDESLFGRYRL